MIKERKGITLIALVITIIILLILAGISISALGEENGLQKNAQMSKERNNEKAAEEKLKMKLMSLVIEKQTNKEYNQDEYLTKKLTEEGFIVIGNIVIVDGYQFEIIRDVPEIAFSLGKGSGNINMNIKINATQEVESDYTKATIKIEIESQEELEIIQIAGEKVEIPEKQDGKYILEKQFFTNGNYNIYVKNVKEEYNFINIKVEEISEDTYIRNAQDLKKFRDRVNKGATYIGKTITLVNDLDLSSICSESLGSFTPIGSKSSFKGTFDGGNHSIKGLYIENDDDFQGLFIYNNGTIKNVIMDEQNVIKAGNHAGAIVGRNQENGLIEKCYNKANVTGYTDSSDCRTGGIAGFNCGEITMCYNEGTIQSECKNGFCQPGGITGIAYDNSKVSKCYNKGEVIAIANDDYTTAGGIIGIGYTKNVTIGDCYNVGTIRIVTKAKMSQLVVGGVAGDIAGTNFYNSYNAGKIIVEDSYRSYIYLGGALGSTQKKSVTNNIWCLDANDKCIGLLQSNRGETTNYGTKTETELKQLASTLGEEWIEDIDNINNGYPILKWQIEN